MECFVERKRMVAFEDVTQPGEGTALGIGFSMRTGNPRVTRQNSWLMRGGLIRPDAVASGQSRITLGVATQFLNPAVGPAFGPGTPITREEFLIEMRGYRAGLEMQGNMNSTWVEANLRSFSQKPNLSRGGSGDWPPVPTTINPDRRRQIDRGTIGAKVVGPPDGEHLAEIHTFGGEGTYSEIWVVGKNFGDHIPPGDAAESKSVELCASVLFEPRQDISPEEFLNSAWDYFGDHQTVFLIESVIASDIPTV